jgi:hypothetical protein
MVHIREDLPDKEEEEIKKSAKIKTALLEIIVVIIIVIGTTTETINITMAINNLPIEIEHNKIILPTTTIIITILIPTIIIITTRNHRLMRINLFIQDITGSLIIEEIIEEVSIDNCFMCILCDFETKRYLMVVFGK